MRRLAVVSLSAVFLLLVGTAVSPRPVAGQVTAAQTYAEHMLEVLDSCKELVNESGAGCFSERLDSRTLTKFEERGQRLGHDVWDLRYRKTAS